MIETLAIVIPCIGEVSKLACCLRSIQAYLPEQKVIIVQMAEWPINPQPEGGNLQIQFVRSPVLSAAAARNLGARSATADYVFFLDSDNWLIEGKMPWCGQILAALAQNPELVVLQREEEGRRFTTDVHPRGRNFSRYCIEWNLIWRRDHFFALGGFDELCGIGNPTLAQTGEVFDLCFKHFDSGIARTVYLPDLRVGHPSLVKIGLSPQRRFENAYGSSFVAIRPLKRRPSILSLFWFTRTVAGCTADIARAGSFAEARLLMGARFLGMWDALSREEPRSRTESERETKA